MTTKCKSAIIIGTEDKYSRLEITACQWPNGRMHLILGGSK